MKLLAGTSGYAFKEWKGAFYPKELKDDGMLGYYASKFPAVEINNTFYRLPKQNVLLDWAAQVPDTFTFALKASQRMQDVVKKLADEKGYDVVLDASNTVHFKATLEMTGEATVAYDKAHPVK